MSFSLLNANEAYCQHTLRFVAYTSITTFFLHRSLVSVLCQWVGRWVARCTPPIGTMEILSFDGFEVVEIDSTLVFVALVEINSVRIMLLQIRIERDEAPAKESKST